MRHFNSTVARVLIALAVCAGVTALLYHHFGLYALNAFRLRGGSEWVAVQRDSPKLSPAMRLALQKTVPAVQAGAFAWRSLASGFEVGELPVIAGNTEVDRILLARIDPQKFRFEVKNAPAGNRQLADWMAAPGTVMVINGSYYGRNGLPQTPLLSNGIRLGPAQYAGSHGAFVAKDDSAGIRDLAEQSVAAAFSGAHDAMVSYPLLIAADGSSRATEDRGWLANRSFVAKDKDGWIVLGTTQDAFFTLKRLAAFLQSAPLNISMALNLDGGPVACQAIALGDFSRKFCGRWELEINNGQDQLLTWRWGGSGRWALPVVLIVEKKAP